MTYSLCDEVLSFTRDFGVFRQHRPFVPPQLPFLNSFIHMILALFFTFGVFDYFDTAFHA
jgi:hypothetical protein